MIFVKYKLKQQRDKIAVIDIILALMS